MPLSNENDTVWMSVCIVYSVYYTVYTVTQSFGSPNVSIQPLLTSKTHLVSADIDDINDDRNATGLKAAMTLSRTQL